MRDGELRGAFGRRGKNLIGSLIYGDIYGGREENARPKIEKSEFYF